MSTADKLNKLLETKEAIKQAIIDKGGTVGDVFAEYPTAIQNIQGGGGSGTFVVPGWMRFGYSEYLQELPENWDWSEIEKEANPTNLFHYCTKLKQVPKLKFADLQSGAAMFNYCYQVTDIDTSEWNTSNLRYTNSMFARTGITTNPPLNTSKATSMREMFAYCSNLTEIKDLDTSSATIIDNLFSNCTKLQAVSELDASNLTSNLSSYNSPFYSCNILRNFGGFKGLKVNMYLDKCYSLSYESLMNVINKLADGVSGKTLYLFQDLVNQLSDDDIAIATSKGWSISPARTITEPVVVTNLNQIPSSTYQITPRTYDFSQYSGSWLSGNSSGLPNKYNLYSFSANISSTTSLKYAFVGSAVRYVTLTGTSNVTDMSYMFEGCDKLIEANYPDWDTSNVTTMAHMFENVFTTYDSMRNIDISMWNTSNVTNMSYMFSSGNTDYLESVKIGNTSNVTDMSGIFSGCDKLTSVTMTGDVSNVTDVSYMFSAVTTEGTFYYNPAYNYSKIIAELPASWTAVPLTE